MSTAVVPVLGSKLGADSSAWRLCSIQTRVWTLSIEKRPACCLSALLPLSNSALARMAHVTCAPRASHQWHISGHKRLQTSLTVSVPLLGQIPCDWCLPTVLRPIRSHQVVTRCLILMTSIDPGMSTRLHFEAPNSMLGQAVLLI